MKYLSALIIALSVLTGARAYAVGFGGPGFFFSSSTCTDITAPVTDKTLCWSTGDQTLRLWNGTVWQIYGSQSFTATLDNNGMASGLFLPLNGVVSSTTAASEAAVTQMSPKIGKIFLMTCQVGATTCTDTTAVAIAQGDMLDTTTSGSAPNWVFTLRKNGVNTSDTCAVSGSAGNSPQPFASCSYVGF